MSEESLKKLIKDIINAWETFDVEALPGLYHKDVIAHMNEQTADYEAIVHRMQYCKQHFSSLKFDPQDIIIADDKIIMRSYQDAVEKGSNEIKRYNIMVIYHVKNDIVSEMWASIGPSVDYFES